MDPSKNTCHLKDRFNGFFLQKHLDFSLLIGVALVTILFWAQSTNEYKIITTTAEVLFLTQGETYRLVSEQSLTKKLYYISKEQHKNNQLQHSPRSIASKLTKHHSLGSKTNKATLSPKLFSKLVAKVNRSLWILKYQKPNYQKKTCTTPAITIKQPSYGILSICSGDTETLKHTRALWSQLSNYF